MTRRFEDKYEARLADRRARRTRWWARPARIFTGALLLAIGVAIGWLPGPGFVPFAIAGGLLLGGEIRWVARKLDAIETWGRHRVERRRARKAFEEHEGEPQPPDQAGEDL